jgi:dTDP-glucose pyrophosphorylase
MKANLDNILLQLDTSIIRALECIETGSRQIALVVDNERHLLGTVTDGDVRRGILRGIGLDQPVSAVMNSQPLTANVDQGREAVLRLMRDREIHQIPLLDSGGRLVGLETLDELIHRDQLDVWVVLMAGGLGARLRPLTDSTPKPLLPVGGRPLLETIIENFANQGFQRIFLSVNYKAEMFEQYFGDGSRYGVSIEYIHEPDRRGTAGALTLLPSRPKNPLIVMNADLLTTLDFRQFLEFHRSHRSLATMGVREYSFQVPYGVVETDQARLMSISEKPVQRFFVSAGMYVLEPDALNVIPRDTFYDMPMLFEALLAQGAEASAFPVREYWLDIGRLDDLERAQSEFEKGFG